MAEENRIRINMFGTMKSKSLLTKFVLLVVFIFLSLSASARNCYGACLIKDGQFYGIHDSKYFPMNSVMKFPQALFVADWMQRNNIRLPVNYREVLGIIGVKMPASEVFIPVDYQINLFDNLANLQDKLLEKYPELIQ